MKLRFHAAALSDLRGIHDYLTERNPPIARSVLRRIRESLERLTAFPYSGRIGGVPGTMELVITGLPYIVVYTVSPTDVEIVAVFHTARERD